METIVGGLNDKKTFLNHVFSNTEEGKAEILNVLQYSFLAIIPVIILNKCVQKFIPEVDLDKSSLEILAEILLQIVIMFIGIIFINRIITFFPTYSGFKYENFVFSNVILAFFIIIFSINTKLGIKVNLLIDRFFIIWDGGEDSEKTNKYNKSVKIYSNPNMNNNVTSNHIPSNNVNNVSNVNMQESNFNDFGPAPANSFLPGSYF
jgi:hypothetical protein